MHLRGDAYPSVLQQQPERRSQTLNRTRLAVGCLSLAFVLSAGKLSSQQDPGPRGGGASAGTAIGGLSPQLSAAFNTGADSFEEVETVTGNGLGPRFNSHSCVSCHSQPASGGTSPAINPELQFVNSRNVQPSFLQANGPVREVRFIRNPDGTPDGGVHDLFTIEGRSDTPTGCNINQPDF